MSNIIKYTDLISFLVENNQVFALINGEKHTGIFAEGLNEFSLSNSCEALKGVAGVKWGMAIKIADRSVVDAIWDLAKPAPKGITKGRHIDQIMKEFDCE